MRCGICFGEHETKLHRKLSATLLKDGTPLVRCPGCMRDVSPKQLKEHKRFGCASAVKQPTAQLRSHDDDGIHNPD
jgi:protein-arginine kinase activator protein McsA